jgi:hypothetical protein
VTATSINVELHDFACRAVEECGGLVDWSDADDIGAVVLPPGLCRTLGVQTDELPIACTPTPGGLHATLGGEFLELFARLLEECVPRVGSFALPDRYLKGGDLRAALDEKFVWQNARARTGEPVATRATYHTWRFQASLRSEDAWDGPLQIGVNAQSLGVVPLPNPLDLSDLKPSDQPPEGADETYRIACARAERQLFVDAAGFLQRLDDRFTRDRKRLRDYYRALLKPASHRRRAGAEPSAEETQAKEQAVELELKRKLLELDERYELQARLTPVLLAASTVNVWEFPLHVQRKRAERDFRLYWNPLLRDFEPLTCSRCFAGTYSVTFADDTVEPLCTPCSLGRTA